MRKVFHLVLQRIINALEKVRRYEAVNELFKELKREFR